jgi:hypothetical protein
MKAFIIFSTLLAIIAAGSAGCKKDNEEANPPDQNADYSTTATINVSYPHVYSFGVTGTTHTAATGNAFTSTSNFTMGQTSISNVIVDGAIQNGQVTFTNKKFLLVFPVPGGLDTIREEVTFSTGPVSFGTTPVTGNGTILLRMIEDTATERGTFTYTLTKVR